MVFVTGVVWPGIVAGSMYALVALAINVVERVTEVVNFAYAGFVLWAPLGVLILVRQFSVDNRQRRRGRGFLGFDERSHRRARMLGRLGELDAGPVKDDPLMQLADLAVDDASLDHD